jgi:RNA polymerase sigma-70 factor (ECF subfamily)
MVRAAAWMRSDDEEFAERYRTHRARVVGLCRRLLGSAEHAEDAAHEVFLRAHARRQDFDRARPFANWVLGITTHYCIDLLRRRSTESRLFGSEAEETHAVTDANPLGILIAQERRRELRDAVASLPARYRVPLVLSIYNEQSYDEIAAALGISRAHVAILIYRAKQQLRKTLSPAIETNRGRA